MDGGPDRPVSMNLLDSCTALNLIRGSGMKDDRHDILVCLESAPCRRTVWSCSKGNQASPTICTDPCVVYILCLALAVKLRMNILSPVRQGPLQTHQWLPSGNDTETKPLHALNTQVPGSRNIFNVWYSEAGLDVIGPKWAQNLDMNHMIPGGA